MVLEDGEIEPVLGRPWEELAEGPVRVRLRLEIGGEDETGTG
jgi:hypothetical protein